MDTIKGIRQGNRLFSAPALVLAFFLAVCLLVPSVSAAPDDDPEETVSEPAEDGEDAGGIVTQENGGPMDGQNAEGEKTGETEAEEETDPAAEETEKGGETDAPEDETGEPDTGRNHGAFTVDGNGVIRDVITDGVKEFYVITTADGSVFYLLIDRAGDAENVYLLTAVDDSDLLSFAASDSGGASGSVSPGVATETDAGSDSGSAPAGEETTTAGSAPEQGTDTASAESSRDSYTGLIVLLLIAAAVVIVILVTRSRKKRKNGRGKEPSQGMELGGSDGEPYDD